MWLIHYNLKHKQIKRDMHAANPFIWYIDGKQVYYEDAFLFGDLCRKEIQTKENLRKSYIIVDDWDMMCLSHNICV